MLHEHADELFKLYAAQGADAVMAALTDVDADVLRQLIVAVLAMADQTAKTLDAVLADADHLRGLAAEAPPSHN